MIFDKHGFTQAADYVWSCFGFNESTFVDTHDFIRLDWAQGSTVQAFPIVNTNFALFFAHWVKLFMSETLVSEASDCSPGRISYTCSSCRRQLSPNDRQCAGKWSNLRSSFWVLQCEPSSHPSWVGVELALFQFCRLFEINQLKNWFSSSTEW